ncbi:DNA repair protein RecN [Thalassotalea atypica]|uniref:DNA repair protein RecN n=1 Tax=Thalassotalea atypica TaxID=2054316 RepID=UPI002574720F|nr:DNA repair protein RecN [Thalassotalea atypica]
MLLQLTIQNFAIVRALDIDWQQGMTTITGETGAGKSIAIDALGLCLGDRATTNVVRPNTSKANLAATFDVTNNQLASTWLKAHELDAEDECILRRVISSEGRSKAYINGSQVPLAQLKEIGQLLINIHGQHDHQLIVKANEQRKILDAYANHPQLLEDVKHYFHQWRIQVSELETLEKSKQQREAKKQLLQYQVNELNEFSLQPDEFESIETEYKRQSHAQHILSETLSTVQTLSENDQFNLVDQLQRSHESINSLAEFDPELNNIATLLNESLIQLEEASLDLRHYHEKLELDPEAFAHLEERYSIAVQLAKKHQVAPEHLVDFHMRLCKELEGISGDESRLSLLTENIEQSKASYNDACKLLTQSRRNAASDISKRITLSMQELNMPHGQFDVAVEEDSAKTLSLNGADTVCFNVSINPGQALEAMHKVASGGELSRISLAMQVILADKIVSPTLIFDEVDVGISGPTASMVGAKLQMLAKNTQVICVTHLPQVACKGHQQMFVAKLTDGEHTETSVTELSEGARIKEIARLLAGDKITENSLANAQELLAS